MNSVPTLSIAFMAVSAVVSVLIPLFLLIFFRKKTGADIAPFFVGCGVFLLFALILESLVHQAVLVKSPVGVTIQGNIWLYALYGGLMAGIFEETGRYLSFRTVLKRRQDNDANALMYGAGHGGFECVALLGVTMIMNIVVAVMINNGNMEAVTGILVGNDVPNSEEALAQVDQLTKQLTDAPSWTFLVGLVERVFAMAIHISLSVIVWFSVKEVGKRALYPLAILMHAAVDGVTVIVSDRFGAVAVECVVAVMALALILWARRVWAEARRNSSILRR